MKARNDILSISFDSLLEADEGMKTIIQSLKFSSSDEMMKASLPPIEDGLSFMTEKEKNVDKFAGEWVLIYQNLTGLSLDHPTGAGVGVGEVPSEPNATIVQVGIA
ncbi:hypothetical protein TorRG33x02_058850 [Trema orientale]|uniref:Uncharacterized protein n=1 Tax=Trema orientale TaxID=63057 RepID=A0A2P5FKJ2_TREOI|nr:hypothetical protein TorRG33x02_058850 [Trema orientale]